MALAGRAEELSRLGAWITNTGGARPPVAGVLGEPGIGKSRLLREFAGAAAADGWVARWGRATEFERHVPFGVFTEALDGAVLAVDPHRLASLGTDRIGMIAAALPGLSALSDAGATATLDIERHRLYAAVRSLLELIAERVGTILVLDDMHWADDGSIELCEYLLRHPPRGRLALALAFRPRQVNPRLAAALDAGADRQRAEVIEIGPLAFEDAAALMPAHLGRSTRQRLYRASGGNPFYLEALARHGGAAGPTVPSSADGVVHPLPVRSALAAELAALDPVQRLVVHAAAVVGDVFEPDLAAEVAGVDLDAALAAVDGLVDRDLVRPDSAGCFRFRHPLVFIGCTPRCGCSPTTTMSCWPASACSVCWPVR